MAELSPMMKQYFEIKEKNKDSILFFRLGDFYEMFFDDAKLASRELDLTLTGRDCGQKERAPMCGVPFHSCESYIARLVQKGYKVAICEQTEDPAKAKGLVKRDIIRVITPGTVIESGMLDEGKNNFISSAFMANNKIGLSFCDISTGELFITEISGEDLQDQLQDQLISYNPREILIGGEIVNFKTLPNFIKEKLSASVEMLTDDEFGYSICLDAMKNQFKENDVNSIKDKKEMVSSVGALLSYLKVTQITGYERINTFEVYNENQYMNLDYNTRRNLELTRTMMNKEKKGSLIWLLDKTKTAMGKRLLRYWLEHPLLNIGTILNRQSAIADLVDDTVQRLEITESLIGIFDIERFTSFEGNTGPYILYTTVRIKSILNKYQEEGKAVTGLKVNQQSGESEKALMLALVKYNEMMENAYEELAPHKICAYIYDLANAFNHFYHETKILAEENEAKKQGYIALLILTKKVLESCIDVLGFEAPERM